MYNQVPRKIWERVLGIEPRRLWSELANAQSELANAQSELANARKRENRLHPFIAEALSLVVPDHPNLGKFEEKSATSESIFSEFGSDKDSRHSYGGLYFEILKDFTKPRILEIGVGSINNFPYAGLPAGGALKAFRKKFSEATIIGIDIDVNSIQLIQALGFVGFLVDQTSDRSLAETRNALDAFGPFDLIIDDGFHDPHANIRTLKTLFCLLSENGTYVIEDIHESLIDFWRVVSVHLPGKIQILDMRDLRPGVDDNILILISK
jgi:hypothetical protein